MTLISKNRFSEFVVNMIESEIENYSVHETSGELALNTKEGTCLMNYLPSSKELYYDRSLREYITKFIPLGNDIDIFNELVKEYFNTHFPEMEVRRVYSANIVSF